MTSNSEPCLIFDPTDELRFKGPFDKNVSTTTLKITNTSAKRVTFKVKTTAPKNYCVRPNQGVVEPGATFAVSVMLQPFDYDPNEKQKHKFLVQTMFMPPGDDVEVEALWKNANEENIMPSAKMRCVFEMPDGSGEAVADRTSEFGSRAASSLGSVASAASASAASDETKRLAEQQTAQINEDIQRKEELIRKRRVTHGVDASSPMLGASPRQGAGGAMGAVQAPAEPIIYVVVGLLTLMIGYLIGKFF